MLVNYKDSSRTDNPFKFVNWVHRSNTVRSPQYVVLASTGTCPGSMPAKLAILDARLKSNIIFSFVQRQGWKRDVCADVTIPTVRDANGNVLQILSAVKFRNRFRSGVFKTAFSIADKFSAEVLIDNKIMNCHANSIAVLSDNWNLLKTTHCSSEAHRTSLQ